MPNNESKPTTAPMTPDAARRIQAAVDRSGGDAGFKARTAAAAARPAGPAPAKGPSGVKAK